MNIFLLVPERHFYTAENSEIIRSTSQQANLIEGWWDTLRQQFLMPVARQMKQEVEGNLIISRLLLFDDRNNCTSLPCCDEHKRI